MPTKQCRTGLLARWQPAALVTSDIVLIKLALGAFALIRAEDYAHGSTDRFGILEAALPLWLWSGWAFTVGALILAGISTQRHFAVWLGHSLGSALYDTWNPTP